MLNKNLFIGALAFFAAATCHAEDTGLSYTYVDLTYQQGDSDGFDLSGYRVGGSAAISDSFFLSGEYRLLVSDDELQIGPFSDDIELTQYHIGVGFHLPIVTNTDFVTSLFYSRYETEFLTFGDDSDGLLATAGVRSKPADIVELGLSVNYSRTHGESETEHEVSARFFVIPKISIGLSYGATDHIDTTLVDVRFDI